MIVPAVSFALWLWTISVIVSPCIGAAISIKGRDAKERDFQDEGLRHLLAKRDSINNGVQLRILAIGASIVYGLKSSDLNGFRYALRNQLVYSGNPVNMVGDVSSGTMADNQCDAWPGDIITQVATKSEQSLSTQPNLALIHVGTNDCVQDIDIENAGSRLGDLINEVFSAVPGVTIVASTLLPNGNHNTSANIGKYNSQIPNLISGFQADGMKITYVDFSSSYFSLDDIGPDGTHPTDQGYLKMAEVWYQGIQVAASQGWITAPEKLVGVNDTVTGGDSTCDKLPGQAIGPVQTQMGSGSDDGAYVHVGVPVYGVSGFANPSGVNYNNSKPEGVFWGDIDGDGIDDYIFVGSNSKYGLGVALSTGGGGLGDYLYSYCSIDCNRPGLHFTDITGDGRDDLCCLGPDGGLDCWENTVGNDPRSPSWKSLGTVKSSEGYPQAQVRLADIDGDGRTDYVVFDASTTNIYGWRNGALQPGPPEYWYAMRGVFSGLPAMELSGWRFVDLNGDKKDDLVWVSPDGAVTTWINRRGFAPGYKPQWVSHGVTHQGSSYPVNVTFGAFMGSGRADYALVSVKNNLVYLTRYENRDHGGTMVRGDGAYYCDMTGSGSDDYVFVNSTGRITVFQNYHNFGYWNPFGVVIDVSYPREQIHLADYDGDGKCDILLVDKYTGHTVMQKNNFADGKFAFENVGIVSEVTDCTEGYGTDKHDRGTRWADIDGDGRADYLCMQTNGVTTGWLNKPNGMVSQGLIKHAEGKERANLRFADINGDGRDDFLYVNPIDGAVTAWYNGGAIESSGSAFQWNYAGNVSTGSSSRGQCVDFGQLYGDGRADYIVVEPATNKAWTYFNVCPDEGLNATTPKLPTGAPAPPQPIDGAPPGVVVSKTTGTNSNGQPTTFTYTIVPITTTDNRGSTVVVSSTEGGSDNPPTQTVRTVTISSGAPVTTTSSFTTQITITTTNNQGSTITTISPTTTDTVITTTISSDSVITTTEPVTSQRITSTMTTSPPGLSIQDFTDYSVTGNFWLTTTNTAGSSTIVPVILPCSTCEPEIIWGEIEIPNVEFNWGFLPNLPTFHLPCVKFLGITIGTCPNPSGPTPITDGPPPAPKPYNPDPEPDEPDEDCTSKTEVPQCTEYVSSYFASSNGASYTTTTETKCYTVTACEDAGTTITTTLTTTFSVATFSLDWEDFLPTDINTAAESSELSSADASVLAQYSTLYGTLTGTGPYYQWTTVSSTTTKGTTTIATPTITPTTTSTTTSGPPPFTTTPSLGPLNCFPATDPHCTIPDVDPDAVGHASEQFYQDPNHQGQILDSTSGNATLGLATDDDNIQYVVNVGWIPGCVGDPINVNYPLGGSGGSNDPPDSQAIFESCYRDCTGNNGHGGYRDVGCLRYGFYPEVYGSNNLPSDYFLHNSPCPAQDF